MDPYDNIDDDPNLKGSFQVTKPGALVMLGMELFKTNPQKGGIFHSS